MNSTSLAMLKNNTSVSLLAKQGNWYKVDVNGTIGYIYGEYIALTNTNSSAINNTSLSSNNKSKIIGTVSSNSKNKSIKVTSSHSNVNKKTTSNKNKPIVKNIQSNSTVGYVYEPVGDGLVGVYQGASDQTALETTLKSGTKVTVLGETNNCYKIKYGNNEIGYIGKQFISFNKATVKNTQSNSTVGYVYENVGDGLVGVYQGASDQTALETTLKSGTKVTVLGETNNCYKIEYGNNEIGYIGKQFISFNKATVKNTQSNSTVGYVYENVGDGLVGVYQGASDQTTLETTLKSGTKVTVLGETNNCYKIEYGNNEIGYIGKQFINFKN